jgi:multidrug efflux system outer membrane protein
MRSAVSIAGLRQLAGLCLAAALGLAAGCTVGPDYHPAPKPPGAEVPLVSTVPSAETSAEPPDNWWHLYHDATLDKLLDEALRANTDLRAAEANLLASRAVLDGARDALFPQTTAAAQTIRGRDAGTDEILELTGRRCHQCWI